MLLTAVYSVISIDGARYASSKVESWSVYTAYFYGVSVTPVVGLTYMSMIV